MEAVFDFVAIAYKAYDETEAFLKSFGFVDVPYTLTIVDNDGSDDMKKVLTETAVAVEGNPECLTVEILNPGSNLGYARACNLGAQYGSAEYLTLLNCDVRWLPGAARSMLSFMADRPAIGVAGPRTTTSDGMITHAGIVRGRDGRDRHRGWMAKDDTIGRDRRRVPTVAGATYFMRRSCWSELTFCEQYRKSASSPDGAFLPTKHYFEETFCSMHARAHGWEVAYNGEANMIHEWHRSSPVGGIGERYWKQSEAFFHRACSEHSIDPTATIDQSEY